MNEYENVPDEEPPLTPPSALRVAKRALVMTAVTCRAFIEQDGAAAYEFWNGVRGWFDDLNIAEEIEPWEQEVLDCPLGSLDGQVMANAQWLCEGLVVLAWALKRYQLPPHDQGIVAAEVSEALGFRSPKIDTVLEDPSLRSLDEFNALSDRMFAIHWRLREFSLSRSKMNFKEFSQTAWFGPLNIAGVSLEDDDLAINGAAIVEAEGSAVRICQSIAVERHRAANWLIGYESVYSETDTST